MWNRLLELRGSKIRKELELRKQHRVFAIMKRKLESLQADCDSVDSQVRYYIVWGILPTIYCTVVYVPPFAATFPPVPFLSYPILSSHPRLFSKYDSDVNQILHRSNTISFRHFVSALSRRHDLLLYISQFSFHRLP